MSAEHTIFKYQKWKIDNFPGRARLWRRMKMRRIGLWK